MTNVIAFRRPIPAPPGPLGPRPVVAALEQRVDVWRCGEPLVTDIRLGDLAAAIDAVRDSLGPVLRHLAEHGKAQVADMVIRPSSTDGRAA